MEALNSVLREIFEALFHAAAGRPIWLSLIPASAVAGLVALLLFGGFSNKRLRRRATRLLWANLLAIRLFADEPQETLGSLAGIIVANVYLLASVLPAFLLMAPLLLLVYGHLDSFFGSTPLTVGTRHVLTVRLNRLQNGWPDARLEVPSWVIVDSPPVHVPGEKEISWSIRATRVSRGAVKIVLGNEIVKKVIDSQSAPRYFSAVRMQSVLGALRYPAEESLPPGPIAEVNLLEPAASFVCCGISLDWTWWFTILSLPLGTLAKWGMSQIKRMHWP